MNLLRASVGRDGVNRRTDVEIVQILLNESAARLGPVRLLKVDGKIGPKTIGAIEHFQSAVLAYRKPDGRVDPGGKTILALNGLPKKGKPPGKPDDAGFDPKGKSFNARMDKFMEHAKATYGVAVGVNSRMRSAQVQQKWHVCHMFVYNHYSRALPRHVEKGSRTIAWSHISDPAVVWKKIKPEDLLRTARNAKPIKAGKVWKAGFEPDPEKSRTYMRKILEAHVGARRLKNKKRDRKGTAMVSAGIKPCGEPCACRVGRSRHVSGAAADVSVAALSALDKTLRKRKAGTIDQYLRRFGLYRPLLKAKRSPEPWHLEALPDARL
jgi:hypothetical protein